MAELKKIGESYQITWNTKINLIISLILSIFLYGVECWTLKEPDERKIDAAER